LILEAIAIGAAKFLAKTVWGALSGEAKKWGTDKLKQLFYEKILGKKLPKSDSEILKEVQDYLRYHVDDFQNRFEVELNDHLDEFKDKQDELLEAINALGIIPKQVDVGAIIKEAFLRPACRLFVSLEEFLRYETDDEIRNTKVYVPRAGEIEKLAEFLNSDNRLLLISGDRGVGKTRLLVEYAKILEGKKTPFRFASKVEETEIKRYEYELERIGGDGLVILIDEIDKLVKIGRFLELIGPYSSLKVKDKIKVIGCTINKDSVSTDKVKSWLQEYELKLFDDAVKLKKVATDNFKEAADDEDVDKLVEKAEGFPDAIVAFFLMLEQGKITWAELDELGSRVAILTKRFELQYEEAGVHAPALAMLATMQVIWDDELHHFNEFYANHGIGTFSHALNSDELTAHVARDEDRDAEQVRVFRSRELFAIYLIKRFFIEQGAKGSLIALAKVVAKTWSARSFLERLLVFQDDDRYKIKCDRAIAALLEEIQKPGSHTEALFRVINILDDRYARRGILHDKVNWKRLKEQLGELPEKKDRAIWLHEMGMVLGHLGEPLEAKSWYEQSLKINKELGNKSGIAITLHQLGNIAYLQGDYKEARSKYEEAKEAFEELGGKGHVAAVLHQLGMIAQQQGDYEEARKLYGESFELEKELGNRLGIAITLHQLGVLAKNQGDYDEARKFSMESFEIAEELGDKAGIAKSLHLIGMLEQHDGNYKEARRIFEECLVITEQLGGKSEMALILGQLGRLAEAEGNELDAFICYFQALNIFAQLNAPQAQTVGAWIREQRERVGPEEFEKLVKQAGEKMEQNLSFVLDWFKDGEAEPGDEQP
jgi:tetratricopeptide (TPR) repeat protein